MKRLAVLFLLTTSAFADNLNEGIVMSPQERAFIMQKMMNMQEKIDDLDRALRNEKVRTGCA